MTKPRETSGGESSFLATRRGQLTLTLVCLAGFLDFLDVTIVNVALPSIRDDLEFSVQDLQWVTSGYLVTYCGFLLSVGAPPICSGAAGCWSPEPRSSGSRRSPAHLPTVRGCWSATGSRREWARR